MDDNTVTVTTSREAFRAYLAEHADDPDPIGDFARLHAQ